MGAYYAQRRTALAYRHSSTDHSHPVAPRRLPLRGLGLWKETNGGAMRRWAPRQRSGRAAPSLALGESGDHLRQEALRDLAVRLGREVDPVEDVILAREDGIEH